VILGPAWAAAPVPARRSEWLAGTLVFRGTAWYALTAHEIGVLDTSIIAALSLYDPADLPDTFLITAITLGELSHGPHTTDDPLKRADRIAVLQHVESTFDPLPYDHQAARFYGQICAAVRAAGRQPRRRGGVR
jgi:predicted nucleic acid-binding protein